MLIAMSDETLYRNIDNDGKQGSGAGDIILHQKAGDPKPAEYQLSYFNIIPDHDELKSDPSLVSAKSAATSIIHRVFVFDKFQVNGEQMDCENRFIVFIRTSGNNPPKVRLACQGENRKIAGTDIDNKLVMDAVSKHLNDAAFTVQALEYKETEDVLNFIVFTYGKSNQASEIFKKNVGINRVLSGYGTLDYREWNNIEFSLHCVQLIRKYKLFGLVKLLCDGMYCRKRFSMNISFLADTSSTERLVHSVNIDENNYFVFIELSENSKRDLWEFLLDRIDSVSEDIVIDSNEYQLKGLKIPDTIDIDVDDDVLEIPFKVGTMNYRKYFYGQKVYQGDYVLLISNDVNTIIAKYLYKVRFVKEESIIFDKSEIMINPTYETEILEEIRGEL